MPVFEYQCSKCSTRYEVFHKVREVMEDVVCPSCLSTEHRKLMSAPSISMNGQTSSNSTRGDSCESGSCGCAGGACSMN